MQPLLATPIGSIEFAAFDSESAGTSPGAPDVPIQIGLAIMSGGVIHQASFFRSYLAVDQPIAWQARRVHGIDATTLVRAPRFPDLWPEIMQRLGGRAVVAHNAGTERRFLKPFSLHRFDPWIDTLPLARAFYPSLTSFKLENIIRSLGLEHEVIQECPGLGWHDALYDAVSSLVFLRHLIKAAGLAEHPLEILRQPDATAYYRDQRSASRPSNTNSRSMNGR